MSEWQIPAKWMSNPTSCGPTSRRVIVVLLSGAVADVAAYAMTVFVLGLMVSRLSSAAVRATADQDSRRMWFHIIVKVVSVKSGLEAKRLDAEVMAFV